MCASTSDVIQPGHKKKTYFYFFTDMKNRYQHIVPKINYYIGLGIPVMAIIAFTVTVSPETFVGPNGTLRFVVFSILGSYLLWLVYHNLNHCIYATLDTWHKTFIYGNLLFKQEIPLASVVMIKKRWMRRNSYWVTIGGRKFVVDSPMINSLIDGVNNAKRSEGQKR